MGKIILCSGTRTNKPYVFQATGIRIYSIEELCWYLNQYVYFIEDTMFDHSLFDFIEKELNLVDRAEKLRMLRQQGADLKTIVTVILCSSDYYTELEIKDVIKTLDRIIGMPPIIRNYIKANNYLKNNQYFEAAMEYKQILNSKEAIELTPEQYGDIYHNLGVATIHLQGSAVAAELFRQAYERNAREESLKQYLCAMKLSADPKKFNEIAERYHVNQDIIVSLQKEIRNAEIKAEESKRMSDINQLKKLKEAGKMTEFYQLSNGMIEEWKASVREVSYTKD